MSNNHQKHPPMTKPSIGHYHRSEWAIYGTTCDQIETFFKWLQLELKPQYKLAYVDADHQNTNEHSLLQIEEKKYTQSYQVYHDLYDDKISLAQSDAVIINGNHYPASKQIVCIDTKKEASLLRRKDQLTQVTAVILMNDETEVFPFIKELIHDKIPIFKRSDTLAIAQFFRIEIQKQIPPLNALILAGGKSVRMGVDKSLISYHDGVSQVEYLSNICEELGIPPYISKSHTYNASTVGERPVIVDKIVDMGPFGGIVSAFMHKPDSAWLVLACDLALLKKDSIIKLISDRDTTKFATSYYSDITGFPEPLLSIYEPRIFLRFLQFMALGYSCPRKVLINSDIQTILPLNQEVITNVNTPEERDKVMNAILKNK